MLTPEQIQLILSHAEPHSLHPEFAQPITPNHIRITVATANRLGITQQMCADDPAYDHIPEYVTGVGQCHVFLVDKLENRSAVRWANYESSRRDRLKAMEVGG